MASSLNLPFGLAGKRRAAKMAASTAQGSGAASIGWAFPDCIVASWAKQSFSLRHQMIG
jgi:hypothetical protein